jgi:hypothetical protein
MVTDTETNPADAGPVAVPRPAAKHWPVPRSALRSAKLQPVCPAGPALLRQQFIESGRPLSDEDITLLVDNVLIPMLRAVP